MNDENIKTDENISNEEFEGYHLFRKFSIIQRFSQIFISNHLKNKSIAKCHAPILFTIYLYEGLTQNELSNRLKFNKGAVAKLVKNIEHEGYIIRRSDKNDRRLQKLYLTDKGRQVIPHLLTLEHELSEKLVQGFTDKEKEILHSFLDRIIVNVINL